MSNRKQSRKWNLTINEPIEKEWTHDKLKDTLQNIASMVYFCLGDEIGENETFHTHLYFVTKNCKPFTTVKNSEKEAKKGAMPPRFLHSRTSVQSVPQE